MEAQHSVGRSDSKGRVGSGAGGGAAAGDGVVGTGKGRGGGGEGQLGEEMVQLGQNTEEETQSMDSSRFECLYLNFEISLKHSMAALPPAALY